MKITGKNTIGYSLSDEGSKTYQAFNPLTLKELPEKFIEATEQEVDRAMELAWQAYETYRNLGSLSKAEFLDAIAGALDESVDEIVQRAEQETGLPEKRLRGEMTRTTNQLRMFAQLVKAGLWVEASIDRGNPNREPAPKPDLRRMRIPNGPVVVFASSNFPLAFSVAGGDTASALAGGNPVVIKAHPSHPGTSELVASVISRVAREKNLPEGVFSLIQGAGYETGNRLVMHKNTKAVGFTGSFQGGMALYKLAQQRKEPIPVFAEMGSINPVFVLPSLMKEKSRWIAEKLSGSITLGVGQFCTKPGLIVAQKGGGLDDLQQSLQSVLSGNEGGPMLNKRIASSFSDKLEKVLQSKGITLVYESKDWKKSTGDVKGRPVVAKVDAKVFLDNPSLHEEVFGPFSLVVVCDDSQEMEEVARSLEGQLTYSVYGTSQEMASRDHLIEVLREKTGRIIHNGVPTGVEVCPSMQHGGPFPATTDGRFTSVGTAAIQRFTRPVAYQDWPSQLLPDELKDENPLQIWRLVDGEWTNGSI